MSEAERQNAQGNLQEEEGIFQGIFFDLKEIASWVYMSQKMNMRLQPNIACWSAAKKHKFYSFIGVLKASKQNRLFDITISKKIT